MNGSGGLRGMIAVLSLVLAFGTGCAKKELVKSTDTAAGAGAASSPAETMPSGQPGGIVTESLKPEVPQATGTPSDMAGTKTAMAEAAAGVAATQEKPSRFPDIFFDYDKAFIREDAKPVLANVADSLKKNPAASVLIEGHCDERGTAEYNLALGERRAESTKNYLVSLGVRPGVFSTVSFGEEKPLDPGHGEDAWAKNRRAHFVLK